ncbi:substrate-binding periplasmic protein [Haliovirga abyssi]|uniref:Solute-binding protein family 3/N-terminal domain-containing protein n=1 Tax=Haliovirga abyssi TaxID=2996794 RepID=A0AAU9DGV5_9FUSO|nr:ABC transporter substrate-binding protein [Haliovirga abyssi]BDU49934.1 hypothetical protein HLVA_05030 [Haliovirga abyssi]
MLKKILFIISLSLIFNNVILGNDGKEFIIYATPTKPFKISPTKGISIEILQLVMKDMKISNYKFKFVAAVKRAVEYAKRGRCSMLIGYSIKKSRLSFLAYPQKSYRRIKWNFFIRKEDKNKIFYNKLEDLKNYTIGVTRGTSYTEEFWKAEKFLKFDYASKNNLQIKKLIGKRFDLVPLNTRSTLYESKEAGVLDKIDYLKKPLKDKLYYDPICIHSDFFKPTSHENTTREEKIKKFLKQYDRIIEKLEKDGTINRIYEEYGYKYKLK